MRYVQSVSLVDRFTQRPIQVSVCVNPLLDTAADCLRFVTEFFEVISQSAPHIYHSALQLAPQSSIVRKLYVQQIWSPLSKVVTGVPASWDSCVASTGVVNEYCRPAWSPCGQFIAVGLWCRVEVRDSNTLGRVVVLWRPDRAGPSKSLAFSPGGNLLACTCNR